MKFEAVVPALRAGKDIRRTEWDTGESIRVFHERNIGSFSALELTLEDLLAEDWEVVA